MTRRRFRKPALTLSLFPFLAVLVCTMGALIVLLVLVVQQAQAHAAAAQQRRATQSEQAQAARQQQLAEQEDFQWRREILEQQRTELTAELSQRRLELSHLEDHIRRLQEKWEQLRAAVAEFDKQGGAEDTDRQQAEAELERLRQAISEARQELADKQQQAAGRPLAFAIIPYDGPHGTTRRPIYIECTESGIILQPEGTILTRADFDGPLGPGNPLDAALRATREYWAQHAAGQQKGEPYPLLVVRPNGTVAYNYAREALKAWDDEFGYELVDGEMRLEFPPSDPALRSLLEQTVEQARQRQAILAAAMPSQYSRAAGVGFVATSNSGFRMLPNGHGRSGFGADGAGGDGQFHDGQDTARENEPPESTTRDGAPRRRQPSTPSDTGQPSPASPSAAGHQAGTTPGPGGAISSLSQRGANWAVPKAATGGTAYQIPVRIVCQYDRLVILPRRGERSQPIEVMAADPLSRTIDEFVQVLWQQIEKWDTAPLGGYWQPVLEVYVYPGAEQRFSELQSLLQGSGIQVQRQAQ